MKDTKIFVFDYNREVLSKEDVLEKEVLWPVQHAFFHNDVLYVSTTEELICLKVSQSHHVGLKVESDQVIGVSAEKVINASAFVNGKIWIGMAKA